MTPAMIAALDLHQPRSLNLGQFATDDEKQAQRLLNSSRASLQDDNWPKKIAAFRNLYNLSQHNQPRPQLLDISRLRLHARLLEEEMNEALDAADDYNFVETVDGILDTIYVALGFLAELGLSPSLINLLFEEVHASNMTKVDSAGQPVYDEGGKVLKGDNYVKPDLFSILCEHGYIPTSSAD